MTTIRKMPERGGHFLQPTRFLFMDGDMLKRKAAVVGD
jgi:hypothetical protein